MILIIYLYHFMIGFVTISVSVSYQKKDSELY